MRITCLPSGPLQANCYIVSGEGQSTCVIVDAGMAALTVAPPYLDSHNLRPVAVLATHGHFDHVGDAPRMADCYDIPFYIHTADRHLLRDPAAGLSPDLARWLRQIMPEGIGEPNVCDPLTNSTTLTLADLNFQVIPVPGHTEGSVVYFLPAQGSGHPVAFTGDTLFAGSIGRTDMPGGDTAAINHSLRNLVTFLPPDTVILPGHGPKTTLATELASNPFLILLR